MSTTIFKSVQLNVWHILSIEVLTKMQDIVLQYHFCDYLLLKIKKNFRHKRKLKTIQIRGYRDPKIENVF
jgi:hypothetical protein